MAAHLGALRGGADENFTARRKDGSTFPTRVRTCAFAGGGAAARVHLVIADRSEAVRARADRDRQQRRLDTVLRSWDAGLLEVGPREDAEDAEDAFAVGDWAALLGQGPTAAPAPGQLLALWKARLHPEDRPPFELALADLADGRRAALELPCRLRRPSGEWRQLRVWACADAPRVAVVAADVSAQTAAQESLHSYRSMLVASSDLLAFVGPDYVYREVNPKFLEAFGVSPQGAVGRSEAELLGPEYFAKVSKPALDRALGGRPAQLQRWVELPGWGRRFMDIAYDPVRDHGGAVAGVLASLRDVTARHQFEEALRESERRFRVITDTAPVGVAIVRVSDGSIRYCNPHYAQVLGVSAGELLGRRETDYCYDRRQREHQARALARDGYVKNHELQFRRDDGSLGWVLSSIQKMELDGEPVLLYAHVDITAEKEAQAQLMQTSKLATIGEMASGMAHELNQPLSIISMAAEMTLLDIEEDTLEASALKEKLERISHQAQRMAEIINHMRLFSRKEQGTRQAFDPVAAVAGAVRLVTNQLQAAGVELCQDLPTACRNPSGHPLQLEQVVLNLLFNARDAVTDAALRHAEAGRPFAPRVRVAMTDDAAQDRVRIAVTDSGGGIPEEVRSQIFDPFFTTKAAGQGTGLGLSISYSIIDAMDGRLDARNVGDGACLEISLPVCGELLGRSDNLPANDEEMSWEAPPRRSLRLLVVGDDAAEVEHMVEALTGQGFAVTSADNALEALERCQPGAFDAALAALPMAAPEGEELLGKLRESNPRLTLVAALGPGLSARQRADAARAATLTFGKPLPWDDLERQLKTLSDRRA